MRDAIEMCGNRGRGVGNVVLGWLGGSPPPPPPTWLPVWLPYALTDNRVSTYFTGENALAMNGRLICHMALVYSGFPIG